MFGIEQKMRFETTRVPAGGASVLDTQCLPNTIRAEQMACIENDTQTETD